MHCSTYPIHAQRAEFAFAVGPDHLRPHNPVVGHQSSLGGLLVSDLLAIGAIIRPDVKLTTYDDPRECWQADQGVSSSSGRCLHRGDGDVMSHELDPAPRSTVIG